MFLFLLKNNIYILIKVIYFVLNKIKSKTNKVKKVQEDLSKNLNYGFYLSISNIIMLIYVMFLIR